MIIEFYNIFRKDTKKKKEEGVYLFKFYARSPNYYRKV